MWLFAALASRILWSGCGATDQVLTRMHVQSRVFSVLVLNLCTYLPFGAVAYFLSAGIQWDMQTMLWCVGGQWIALVAVAPYYHCVQHEQSYNIIPYFEFTPVFLMLMAAAFLGETLAPLQILGAAIVILCGFAFSWDFAHGRIKRNILAWMCLSSLCYAFFQMCLKKAGTVEDAFAVAFYITVSEGVTGFIALFFLPRVRQSIMATMRASKGRSLHLSMLTSGLAFMGLVSITYAFQQAPTAGHVAALSGTQPFFAFALAVMLGRLLPGHFETIRLSRETKLKFFLIAGIFAGVYLLH